MIRQTVDSLVVKLDLESGNLDFIPDEPNKIT